MSTPRLTCGIVAQVVVQPSTAPGFERRFAALVAALAGASGEVDAWRVRVGVAGGHVDAAALAVLAARAGGAVDVVAVADVGDPWAAHRGLAEGDPVEGDPILVVDANALVLASTVERLVRAARRDGAAGRARELPLPASDGLPACALLSVAHLATGWPTSVERPEAVAFRDRLLGPTSHAPAAPASPLILDLADGIPTAQKALGAALLRADEPLLSVVMRTQLRRPEALRDVLLCLAAQDDPRFELLLVAHDIDPAPLEALLADVPAELRRRTTLVRADGGTRSRPLNAGFAVAHGSHVAVLDDDDVVFAQWVGTFLDAATSSSRVLRAGVGVQRVAPEEWPDGILGHATRSSVSSPYPATFDLVDHFGVNMSPFMAFAFPRAILDFVGGVDEELEVCEDWDLVLRTARVVGVTDLPVLTAVYRRWLSADDSYSQHADEVWERDMTRIRSRLDALPLALPPGSAAALTELARLRTEPSELAAVYASTSWRVTAPLRALSRIGSRLRRSRSDA